MATHATTSDGFGVRPGGTIDAYARGGNESVVAVEVPADAVAALAGRWTHCRFVPAAGAPDDALQSWLGQAAVAGLDGGLLLGHAESIQRQRRARRRRAAAPRHHRPAVLGHRDSGTLTDLSA
jgi:hypothetical protein